MRTIVVDNQTFRWRFKEQLVVIPAERSSSQLVVAWGWEDWLEPGDEVSAPQIVTPRFVSAAIQFALQSGWNTHAAGPPCQLAYDPTGFQIVMLEHRSRHNQGGYTIPASAVIDYPPTALEDFHVYAVEWIDNLHFILPPEKFLAEPGEYLEMARIRWLLEGWEGDGEIGLLWLPAFVFPLARQPGWSGVLVWHVKQLEDGISWLLSPVTFPFEKFAARQINPRAE